MEEINLSLDSQDIFKSVNVGSSPVGTNDSLNISLQSNSSPSVTNVSSIGGGEDLGIDLLVNKSKLSKEENKKDTNSFSINNSVNNNSDEIKIEEFSISNLDTEDISKKAEEPGGFFSNFGSNNMDSSTNDINIDDVPIDLNNNDGMFEPMQQDNASRVR